MNARWPIALALLGLLAAPPTLGAQGRVSAGARAGRPIGPRRGPRQPPPIHQPFRTTGIVPPFAVGTRHRPIPFRSSVFGLVFVDPYWWLAPGGDESVVPLLVMAPPGPRLIGGLQLDVEPRSALVYVDGVFAGRVDQFSGYYQHLEADAGVHVIELDAPDYEPLTISVTVVSNRTTTYRGSLNRASRY